MTGIPISHFVAVNPGVVGAGGTGLDLLGLLLTTSSRVPIGTVQSFASQSDVAAFFGGASAEATDAAVYFSGYDNSPKKPSAILVAQYPTTAVPSYLRGGNVSTLSLAQLQAITGQLAVTVDGQAFNIASVNLATATSFSNAAALLTTQLGASDAVVTGAIAPATASVTASIALTTMTVTAVGSGTVIPGEVITGGAVVAGTTVVKQLTGPGGGVGTYQVSVSQTQASATLTCTSALGILTVSAIASGVLAGGQVISGTGVTVGTVIQSQLSGTAGGDGAYIVNPSQTTASTTINAGAAVFTYDSQSGAFILTGGTPGAALGSITFASGAGAIALELTQATGAVISQGADPAAPVSYMTALAAGVQNWATFFTAFTPVTADKVSFSQWTSTTNNRFAYIMYDLDVTVTTASDSTSAGALIKVAGYSGTCLIYQPTNLHNAAFISGAAASIDFTKKNGRTTFAYLSQAGITPGVSNGTIAAQLEANGYNYYGLVSGPNISDQFFYPGSITGEFAWVDSYLNQMWMNAGIQAAVLNLLRTQGSIPYNASGRGSIQAACLAPINAALNFGAIQKGVTLSAQQADDVNGATGVDAATVIQNQGWYLQILAADAATRAARKSPPITLWYADGESVQSVNIQSLAVQ